MKKENIKIGLFKYKVERLAKSPIRCQNCKMFGHSIKACKNSSKCAKCGKDTHEGDCENNQIKCLNCEDNHSSYYKGCPKYKELMKKEVAKTNETTKAKKMTESNERGAPEGFKRNNSSMANSINQPDISSLIQKELNGFMLNIAKQLTDFTNQITKNMNEIKNDLKKSIGKQILDNNIKLSYFFIDMIKTIIPNCQKPDEKTAHAISNRFNNHQLGNLSSKTLTEYVNKLWK